MNAKINRFETDVLIVGGGGAATAAAISAHENGARTMLAVKGRFGVPGVRGAGARRTRSAIFGQCALLALMAVLLNPPELVYRDRCKPAWEWPIPNYAACT